ncbi:class I lanthipeptide [Alistipes dispar]|uniref:class I lanthipeptide n=1 Tax=Alistipes dispar TaxID=2585119 RepID=UPI003A8C11EA
MKKLQLKKEVIANLDNQTSKMVKGGTYTLPPTQLPSQGGTCTCDQFTNNGCVETMRSICYCPSPTTPEAGCPAETHAGKECEKTHDCIPTGISACDACQETAH